MHPAYQFTPEDDPDGVTAMFDPYSAWSLRYALDFDIAATEDRDDPHDFNYMITVSTMQAGEIGDLPAPFGAGRGTQVVALTRAEQDDGAHRCALATHQALAPFDPASNPFSALCAHHAAQGTAAAPDQPVPGVDPGSLPEAESETGAAEIQAAAARESADEAEAATCEVQHFRALLRRASLPATAPQLARYAARGLPEATTTLVGVIDDAINPLHDAFRDGAGRSRVDFAWVQDAAAPPTGATTVPFGRELSAAQLDAALATPAPEADRLAQLGLADFTRAGSHGVARRLSHGCHVASLAGGGGPDHLRLLTVQLPAAVTKATSGGFLSPFVMAGVAHILDRALLISQAEGFPIPVVINFSYSLAGGPHNGLHFLERAIDTLVQAHLDRLARAFPSQPGRAEVAVVLPAGNRLLARGHALCEGRAEGRARKSALTLPWRVQPGDESSNFLEIWLPRDAAGVELRITPPQGPAMRVTGLSPGRAVVMHPAGDPDAVIGRLSLDRQRGSSAQDGIARKQRVLIALAPSCMPAAVRRAAAPAGLWQVELRARIDPDQRIEAWLQRDDAPLGHRRAGLQSYFDDPAYQRWDAMGGTAGYDSGTGAVRRAGGLNGLATGRATTVIAASLTRGPRHAAGFPGLGALPGAAGYAPGPGSDTERTAAPYAPQSSTHMRRPDGSAEADRSALAPGVIGAGAASGSRLAMNGSSVAAPQYARYLADCALGLSPPAPALWPDQGEADHAARLGSRALPPRREGVEAHR